MVIIFLMCKCYRCVSVILGYLQLFDSKHVILFYDDLKNI